ncbi:hypothetical protein GFS24_20095 [Chitinophaga sp. SYP-B3965]|uniref:ComEA family DNA-binding protein n=1 Tax=Chitinophaga sp. SYP-B3965 TaxID=2663120 RepID=UPI001299C692|nr:helix-hairpin-helix domain-containing protein [Chitinophaga sp. SYP-B3965]MRG47433.1 hypothetical protein [Chitinophaga sp. SYP-B3965]
MGSRVKCIWLLLFICQIVYAQEEEAMQSELEQQEHALPENDEQTQQREQYTHRKLNLNTADVAALESLGLLHALQIEQFLLYRSTLGALISIYELQAVPGFSIPLIRTLLPYVHAGNGFEPYYTWKDYLKRGRHTLLARYAHPFQTTEQYRGSADKMLLRYRYQFSRYASWGIVMEKDAGEKGFDHYGIHVFFRNIGRIKALALGDYTVNMGQGLIQWHGLAFGKSSAVMHTKREGDVLRPYASAGEFFFYRGAGITCQTGPLTFTAFMSSRKLDGAGTLISTGYHRTNAELALKGNITQTSAGAVLKWSVKRGHVAWNIIGHKFSRPLDKGGENTSIDHAFNWRNLHVFGEAAVSKQKEIAILQGAMVTLAHGVDLGILYRKEDPAYETLYGNAFGENATPGNESGLYTALLLKGGAKWELSAYADVFQLNKPSEGYDVLISTTWRPDKTTELNAQLRYDDKSSMQRQQLRGQWTMQITDGIVWKSKVQVSNIKNPTQTATTQAPTTTQTATTQTPTTTESPTATQTPSFLAHQQCHIKRKNWQITAAYTWFDTAEKEGLYLTGQGFPGDHSLARFSGKGSSTHITLQYNLSKKHKIWCRWSSSNINQNINQNTKENAKQNTTAIMLQYQLLLH